MNIRQALTVSDLGANQHAANLPNAVDTLRKAEHVARHIFAVAGQEGIRFEGTADSWRQDWLQSERFVLLDVPESLLVERVCGRRTDPETGKVYHLNTNPPPTSEIAVQSLNAGGDASCSVASRNSRMKSPGTRVGRPLGRLPAGRHRRQPPASRSSPHAWRTRLSAPGFHLVNPSGLLADA